MTRIDLDAHATTPLHPAAWAAMADVFAHANGNPASGHHAGRQARRRLDDARETVARTLGTTPDAVVFTSGATEANNLAVFGQVPPGGGVILSRVEHPCVTGPAEALQTRGHPVAWAPVLRRGTVEPAGVAALVTPETRLVCVMLANHETGAIQPVRAVVDALPPQVAVHTDAAQAVGKIPVSFPALGVWTLSLSGHKFGGPKGVGALVVRPGVTLNALVHGGHQQGGRRAGTEPVALAVGLAAALEVAVREMADRRTRLDATRVAFLAHLETHAGPVVVNGPRPGDTHALPSCLNVSFPGCRADVLLVRLDLLGVGCSAGAACASGSSLPSPVLGAMGVPDDLCRAAVRFSFGPGVTRDDALNAADRVAGCVRAVRG